MVAFEQNGRKERKQKRSMKGNLIVSRFLFQDFYVYVCVSMSV